MYQMDPIQKAVINHTFGVTLVPKKKQVISCNVCQLRFNSDLQAEAHFRGSRHAKKFKSQENKTKAKQSVAAKTNGRRCDPVHSISTNTGSEPPPSSPPSALSAPGLLSSSSSSSSSSKSSPPAPVTSTSSSAPPVQTSCSQDGAPSAELEEEKAKKLLYCSLCKVAVNSLSQLEAHNAGSKHKTMLEARSGAGPIKAYPRPGAKLKSCSSSRMNGSGLQNKTFHCQICNVHVNSEIQLKQHISSRRHKDRVAGKPTKPKYSPYNKQRGSSLLIVSLFPQKELVKPTIAPSFLSTPFAPSPSPLPSPISLPPSPTSSLFSTSFLRPAPGPIRASHRPILFSPY
ncbi:zinc finger protein 385B isoform X1 [Nematolebias whitei]|uniref:zinc finger protein 385B isoform X1 n=1 Tax=Nematolebias whitei TaxID=451745 RepID=UPI0018978F0E|nr:zinc finger protein 385B isoform X1 [Nematolebias whitei]